MSSTDRPPAELVRSRPFLGRIGLSSVGAAAITLATNVAAGRVLGADGYARFMIVWGLFFAVTGVLAGIQHEVTRSVTVASQRQISGERLLFGVLGIGLAVGALMVATALSWAPVLLGRQWIFATLVFAVAAVAYSFANFVNGALAARGEWSTYASALVLEATIRAGLLCVALFVGSGVTGWSLALAGAAFGWILLLFRPGVRAATRSRGDASTRVFVLGTVSAMTAAACSSVLVTGFPVLLGATRFDAEPAQVGIVLAALMATRAPVLVLLSAYQSVFITQLARSRDPVGLLRRWLLRSTATAVPVAVAGWLVGPALLRIAFGPEFRAGGGLFIGLVASTLAVTAVTLTGWTALAKGRKVVFAGGWLLAVAGTAAALAMPLDVDVAVPMALCMGPGAGALAHIVTLLCAPRPRPGGVE